MRRILARPVPMEASTPSCLRQSARRALKAITARRQACSRRPAGLARTRRTLGKAACPLAPIAPPPLCVPSMACVIRRRRSTAALAMLAPLARSGGTRTLALQAPIQMPSILLRRAHASPVQPSTLVRGGLTWRSGHWAPTRSPTRRSLAQQAIIVQLARRRQPRGPAQRAPTAQPQTTIRSLSASAVLPASTAQVVGQLQMATAQPVTTAQ